MYLMQHEQALVKPYINLLHNAMIPLPFTHVAKKPVVG